MQLFFRAFSVLSHPVFVPLYAVLLLQYANPYLFGVWLSTDYFFIVGTILFNAMFFPLVTLALMRALGFIEGYSLESRYERIIVLMAVCVYYIWTFNVFIRTEYHEILSDLMLGASIGVSIALVVHSVHQRLSWHAMGMGGLVAFVLSAAQTVASTNMLPWAILVMLGAGLTGTARLYLGKHEMYEVVRGYWLGFLSMTIALLL